jgi:3-methyladenine DNA glycosylase Tag
VALQDFDWIYQHGLDRFGDARALQALLGDPASEQQLRAVDDSRYLSLVSRRVFRAGLKHSLVDAKWPAFEQAFFDFKLQRIAAMSDEELEALMGNRQLIRHWNKLKSVRSNAVFLLSIAEQFGSVGEWLASWPVEDIVGLWTAMKKQGSQLGGNSAAYFLRMAGKDTFILTEDVVTALMAQGIVDKKPTSQKDLQRVQLAFNHWRQQSGRPLCQISRLLAMTVNY